MAATANSGPEPHESTEPPFDYAKFCADFTEQAQANGFTKTRLLKIEEDEIALWRKPASSHTTPKRIFVSAGMHGDEPAGPLALLFLLERKSFSDAFEWIILPALNPSGLRLGTRENQDHIDLNRDFLRLESREIQAFTDWWRRDLPQGCTLHLSLHEDWEFNGFYFYAINSSSIPCFARPLQAKLAQQIPLQSEGPIDDHALDAPGLIIHCCEADEPDGWPEAIWITKNNTALSYTFEAPSSRPLDERVSGLATCVKEATRIASERLCSG